MLAFFTSEYWSTEQCAGGEEVVFTEERDGEDGEDEAKAEEVGSD